MLASNAMWTKNKKSLRIWSMNKGHLRIEIVLHFDDLAESALSDLTDVRKLTLKTIDITSKWERWLTSNKRTSKI